MPRLSTLLLTVLLIAPTIIWAEDIPRPEHPTPDCVREHWANLNGKWDFRFDGEDAGLKGEWFKPDAAGFDQKIVVPFCWESELSGVPKTKEAQKVGWYRRTFEVPKDFPKGDRVWLKFAAVDYRADVWVDGTKVGDHEGGYTPFEFDVTDKLKGNGPHTVVVRAFDPTDPSLPTGKQVGWYTTTSGIWQTVWMESRPMSRVGDFKVVTSIKPGDVRATFTVDYVGLTPGTGYKLTLRGMGHESQLGFTPQTATYRWEGFGPRWTEAKLWTPETPVLHDVTIELATADGKVIDSVKTYFGLRTIARGKLPGEDFERIFLNGKPIYLRGALDQSFNPKGIYTAPTDAFLKQDIELAKSVGTNFLRIHIKPDEPRRLYWADKLGMLIMEDMPNTWNQNDTARKSWESTMREVIARDINHPSIFAWVDFNETWGLGSPPDYKKDKDTQAWVKSMVAETRKLDPTRLVEDNSPCNYDHVEGSDLNSWHFYIDDHNGAKRHIQDVVDRSNPGSTFNYVPDEKMNTSPLINSEYGSVSAGGGDRDVSWGFRDLTTQLRKHNKIQGYIYTELSDIEWEHNGFFDYDRGKKEFGYDSFVPMMTPKDLQGADFIGYDAPPAIEAKPGETIRVPLFVSHYSELKGQPKIRWWVRGVDGVGGSFELPKAEREAKWTAFGVTDQEPLSFVIPQLRRGLGLVLLDEKGHQIAANFVNIVVSDGMKTPRVERSDKGVTIRYSPQEFSSAKFSGGDDAPLGKVWGRGAGSISYKFKLPDSVVKANPTGFVIRMEAGSKNSRDQVDWPQRVNSQDNPQTDERVARSTMAIDFNGHEAARLQLNDDPADARGVLSHLRRIEHGSYGELINFSAAIPPAAIAEWKAGKPLILTFRVPEDAKDKNGLSIYGAESGAYPFDPELILITKDQPPQDLGVKPTESLATDVAAARKVAIVRAGDSNAGPPTKWSYTMTDPGATWLDENFDVANWKTGQAGFGTPDTPGLQDRTLWDTPAIWLRTTVDVPTLGPEDVLSLHMFHDEDVEIFVNGKPLFIETGYISKYQDTTLKDTAKLFFHPGKNIIAVKCKQTRGGQGIDLGITLRRP